MPDDTFTLRTAMDSLQGNLEYALTSGRKILPHPDEVGENTELHWATMLRNFLPKRYEITKAIVVDVNGDTSDLIDMVIHDVQYSPRIFHQGTTSYVPAESVYAVFEMKQEMNKGNLVYAGDKVASVRRLERTSAAIPTAQGTWEARVPAEIVGGVLSLTSSWNPPFGDPFDEAMAELGGDRRLDIGCAAAVGAFARTDDLTGVSIWPDRNDALVWFATRLFRRLQLMATVPAIDMIRWADAALGTPQTR